MKKLNILIPSLVATTSMPVIGLVGCSPTSMTVSIDKWYQIEERAAIICSDYLIVPNKCAVTFTSARESYQWTITPNRFCVAYTDSEGDFVDNLWFDKFELYAGDTKLEMTTDYFYEGHKFRGNYIEITQSGVDKVYANGQINPLHGNFISLGKAKVRYLLQICGTSHPDFS